MQPDLLSAQTQEQHSESLTPETSEFESISTTETSQIPVNEHPTLKASPAVEKKRVRINLAAVGLGIFVLLLLAALAGVMYWGFTLNTKLTSTQQQLSTLQSGYSRLQSDYLKLVNDHQTQNTQLSQTKTDLEKAKTDLTAAQAELSKSNDQNKDLESKLDTAGKLTEVLYAWNTTDDPSDLFRIDTLINETENKQVISQWNTFAKSPSDEALNTFMDYLITAIRNSVR